MHKAFNVGFLLKESRTIFKSNPLHFTITNPQKTDKKKRILGNNNSCRKTTYQKMVGKKNHTIEHKLTWGEGGGKGGAGARSLH